MLSMSFLVDIRYDIVYNTDRIRVKTISIGNIFDNPEFVEGAYIV